jgi:ubiquinone/menaquinone biosynthesis C-methylase UbiE
VSYSGVDTQRIAAEYERRAREIPADYYRLSRPANLLMREHTIRACLRLLDQASLFPLNGRRIADIGCGFGGWLVEFLQWGANPQDLAGIDLMPDRFNVARRRVPEADLHLGSAAELPWSAESFDLVSQFLVFHNLLDPQLRQAVAKEMLRILKPGGYILWFDLRVNNPRNHALRALRASEIRALFPNCRIDLRATLLAPPLSRFLAAKAWPLAEMLHGLPFLRTHYAGLIRKPPCD